MIPENRVKRALLNVEKKQVLIDITQLRAAILHLNAGGKNNYDAAKEANDRQEDYSETSDEILKDLQSRLEERNDRLDVIIDELALFEEDDL
jgi:hypothetical protein